jgi:small subunit ribosomal protein S4
MVVGKRNEEEFNYNKMGRYLGPKDKLSRREGVNLFGKAKNPLQKRNYPPGMHGPSQRSRLSTYGQQLREKQKAKRIYGLLERQFVNYFKKALARTGDTGEILVQLLELRLDNVVYRSGLADTRAQARQLVNHGFFQVNSHKVDIPSYECKIGDVISLKELKKKKNLIKDLVKKWENKTEIAEWLAPNHDEISFKVVTIPVIDINSLLFDTRLIIEFYSK